MQISQPFLESSEQQLDKKLSSHLFGMQEKQKHLNSA